MPNSIQYHVAKAIDADRSRAARSRARQSRISGRPPDSRRKGRRRIRAIGRRAIA